MTTSQQRLLIGLAAGAAAVLAGSRWLRSRHAMDFAGRVVVITGGSRGLGLVMARQFAAESARLVLLARDAGELDRARRLLEEESGANVTTIRCDIRRRADVRAAVAQIFEKFTAVDVLVNNAGIIQVGPVDHMGHEDYENALATHFWGPLHLMLEIVPSMRRRGFGRIVNITSIGGRIAVPHLTPYCASKFALTGLSRGLRTELLKDGIAVTTICPGLMRTGSPRNAGFKGKHREEYAWFSISDALPLLSVSAERAAREIISACRSGRAELVISVPAKLAVLIDTLLPEITSNLFAMANKFLLPEPGGIGEREAKGRESASALSPSWLTTLNERAAVRNNEVMS
jgi:NAD(P)-dependent dehydrogenase (short-subunit alcohol dehydrogenase family)